MTILLIGNFYSTSFSTTILEKVINFSANSPPKSVPEATQLVLVRKRRIVCVEFLMARTKNVIRFIQRWWWMDLCSTVKNTFLPSLNDTNGKIQTTCLSVNIYSYKARGNCKLYIFWWILCSFLMLPTVKKRVWNVIYDQVVGKSGWE